MPGSTRIDTHTLPPHHLYQRRGNDKDRLVAQLAVRVMNAAARVWGVAELASLICAWCYTPPSPERSSDAQPRLVNLARVNKFVSDAASRHLWRDLPSMRPLLSLLPPDLVDLQFGTEWNPATSPLPVVKRSSVPEDYSAYLRYAALVHSIKSSETKRACFVPSSLFDHRLALYADQNGNMWTFPRLQELQLELALREDQIRPILHLINPSLQSITLTFVGDGDSGADPYVEQCVCQLMSTLRMTSPPLKTFSLKGLHCGPTWLQSTSTNASTISNFLYTAPLQDLVLFVRHSALLPLFTLLSKRHEHQLKLLHLVAAYHDTDPLPACEGSSLLPTLEVLALETDHTLLCRQLSFGTLPQVPKLRTLRCLLTDFAEEEIDLHMLFVAIAQYARSDAPILQEVVVTSQKCEYLPSPPILRAAALKPLTVLAHLKRVDIELEIFCQVTPQLLDSFVHAWGQHLERLVISPCPHVPVDACDILIGLEDVIAFAAHCPHMHTLGILFTENEGPIYEYFPRSTALRALTVGSSPIFSVDYCTKVLQKGFPKLKAVQWSDPGTFASTCDDYDVRWERVEIGLGLC